MARKPRLSIDEGQLSKGHLRKLNALRKSLGDDIAERAFAEWYTKTGGSEQSGSDKNAAMIADTLVDLINKRGIRIPRGGYVIKRGRGRVTVEAVGL